MVLSVASSILNSVKPRGGGVTLVASNGGLCSDAAVAELRLQRVTRKLLRVVAPARSPLVCSPTIGLPAPRKPHTRSDSSSRFRVLGMVPIRLAYTGQRTVNAKGVCLSQSCCSSRWGATPWLPVNSSTVLPVSLVPCDSVGPS